MTNPELHSALNRLHAEVQQASFRDPQSRQQVESLIREIEQAAGSAERRPAVRTKIDELVRRFEVEHPVLTGALSRIGDALSAMGI